MVNKEFADKLVSIGAQQLEGGLKAQQDRMKIVTEIIDLNNNKVIEMEDDVFNIPFPILAGHVDQMYSKIDNPPTLDFTVPNKKQLSEKVKAAWSQEMRSTRAGWRRKDRHEKKQALLSGRGVSKIYASSVNNKYRSHYDVVDIYSFVADPTRGFLDDGNYHGETDIFKTHASLQKMAENGFYDMSQVKKLLTFEDTPRDGGQNVVQNKYSRLKAMGVDIETTSFAGQKGVNLTEWIMNYEGEQYYLLFDPKSRIWVRAEKLKDVFANGKSPFVSWATHYDEFNFWTKGIADDIYPIAEAMRFLLNNALENEKRRSRPMRIVDGGALVDINELQEYVPDNVILRQPGKDPNIVDVVTPEITTTVNLVQYFDSIIQSKTGITDPSIEEKDAKVGVFFGKLQVEADRIGTINKEYSESYEHKGYRFFWGLKEHLTGKKQVEMLGKKGIKLQELSKVDFKDVDDVDDVLVSGGSREQEQTAIENERQMNAIKELSGAYPDRLNPDWVIKETLKKSGYDDDEIARAVDVKSAADAELMDEADEAIQQVLLGKMPNLNMAANTQYLNRILDYVRNELNWVKLDKNGNEVGIDKQIKKHAEQLLKFVEAHRDIIVRNMQRDMKRQQLERAGVPIDPSVEGAEAEVSPDMPTETEKQLQAAQPFEKPTGTAGGVQAASQEVSRRLR